MYYFDMKRNCLFVIIIAFFILLITTINPKQCYPSIAGDLNSSTIVDLNDAIIALQIVSGIDPQTHVHPENSFNQSQKKIDLKDAIYILQLISQTRDQGIIWFKDADKDSYSDGQTVVSAQRPSPDYFGEEELRATSGDLNDANPSVHPDGTPNWVVFDENSTYEPDSSVEIQIPISTPDTLRIDYNIPGLNTWEQPVEGEIYDQLNIQGSGNSSIVGAPKLPLLRHFVSIPNGASVSAQVISSNSREIENYYVYRGFSET